MCKNYKSIFFLAGIITAVILTASTAKATAVDISQVPLDAQGKAAPALIMFVLDDSGSMDWEFMTVEPDGLFQNEYYVFDNPGDNLYNNNRILTYTQRLMWKSQWHGYNRMYYNPAVTYEPWPTLPDADPDNPRSHPMHTGVTFNLSDTYLQLLSVPPGATDIIVDNQDSGFERLYGDWDESGAISEYNNSSLSSSDSGDAARWTINIPATDNYQVWAWWSSRPGWNRDTAAEYVVNHAAGSTTYVRNQTQDFGQWNLLGVHAFNAGTTTIDIVRGNNTVSADAVRLIRGTGNVFNIPRAHYYEFSNITNRPYLVTIDGGIIQYYAVTLTGTGSTQSVTSVHPEPNPPDDILVTRTFIEERQNFANWYSFYRRRELTATAAVANVISQMAGVRIGISTINETINQPVMDIKIEGKADQTNELLNILYDMVVPARGTPLRRGLQDVGRYFDQNDGHDDGIGPSPWASAAEGGECQQAFAILMTDGFWNGANPKVGNVDYNDGPPFADNFSNTLADVARYYWENDLSSELNDLVAPSAANPAIWQHMVTYGVSFGVPGTLNPDDFDLSASSPPNITWPNPHTGDSRHKIDDLFHASVNGHGVFLNASNPTELIDSLLHIMQNIRDRIGSASSVAVNGDQLYKRIDDNTFMFQSSYDTIGWLGDIRSFKVSPLTGAIDLLNPEWSAKSVWQNYDWNTFWDLRPIATHNGTNGVPFRIGLGNLTAAQQALLGTDDTTQQNVLNYIRGDNSNEQLQGGTFRNRVSRLGTIVHSSPIYHNGLLYVGANDGMMHAIIAEGSDAGKKLFSYLPSQVIQNLHLLTDPLYSHHYYVNLTVSIQERVKFSPDNYKTLLVGGLAQGGKGYYALDISNLTNFDTTTKLWQSQPITEADTAARVLWEFPNAGTSAADNNDIGYSFSESLIVRSNSAAHPWVVIFGNGYNSTDGQSVLFILDPITGNVLNKFELGAGPDNGLSTPAVTDVNNDGQADYVYVGDLHGNMWKIDLTADNSAEWAIAFTEGSAFAPLFRAVGPTGIKQPITSKPDVMRHPYKHGYMVVFGTGKFLGTSDFLDHTVQTVYGVWDYGDNSDNSESLGIFDPPTRQLSRQSSYSTLLEQIRIIPDFFYDPDNDGRGEILRILSRNPITWLTEDDRNFPLTEYPDLSISAANNAGWYFNLPNQGERMVSRMMIRDGKAIFISFTPNPSPCTPGGDSIIHELNVISGGRLTRPAFDVNLDGVVNNLDMVQITVTDPDTMESTTINVVPTGIQRAGHMQPPAILRIGDEEIKYMSSTAGIIETVRERAPRMGVTTWKEF